MPTSTEEFNRPLFDGETFDEERDGNRLLKQLGKVSAIMSDGRWHTLAELADKTGNPEASLSARLRDLRKKRFGGHIVERQFVRRGLFKYRMVVKP